MHLRQRLADLAAVFCFRLPQPHAFKEGNERGRTARQRAEQRAILARQWQRTRQAACRQMLHQAEEERQIALFHPLFIERQDEGRLRRMQQEVGILDALGDALVGEQLAGIIFSEKPFQLVFGDIGINCQGGSLTVEAMLSDGCGGGELPSPYSPFTNAMSAVVSSRLRSSRLTRKCSFS